MQCSSLSRHLAQSVAGTMSRLPVSAQHFGSPTAASRRLAQRCFSRTLVCSNRTGLHGHRAWEARPVPDRADDKFDLVLSSGFLAFASHSGFLQAVEEAELQVAGVMGTSAGALSGSLFAAGYTAQQVAAELSRVAPIELLQPSWQPWRGGLLSLEKVVEKLYELLPPTFEDLKYEFACGVVTGDGEYRLVDRGPLPEAVAASAAIPFVFTAVDVPGLDSGCKDGGMVDRIGLRAWRSRRRDQLRRAGKTDTRPPPALVHVITRSSPFSGVDDVTATGEVGVTVLRSPRSNVNFFDLGEFESQMQASYSRSMPIVQAVQRRVPAEKTFA